MGCKYARVLIDPEDPEGAPIIELKMVSKPEELALMDFVDVAKTGSAENGNLSCTKFPTVYTSKNDPVLYLDTRGFFDSTGGEAGGASSSILTDMAIRAARSVRVVFLMRTYDLEVGFSSMERFVDSFSGLFKTTRVPIFFLFNDYRSQSPVTEKLNSMKTWTEKSILIRKIIQKRLENINNGNLQRSELLKQRVLSSIRLKPKSVFDGAKASAGAQDSLFDEVNKIADDEESKELRRKIEFTNMIRDSVKNGWFGYINPTVPESLAEVRAQIMSSPEVPRDQFVFNGLNSDRAWFEQVFTSFLSKRQGYYMKTLATFRYNPIIQHMQTKARYEIKVHQEEREN